MGVYDEHKRQCVSMAAAQWSNCIRINNDIKYDRPNCDLSVPAGNGRNRGILDRFDSSGSKFARSPCDGAWTPPPLGPFRSGKTLRRSRVTRL